jgi:hypothetical protein
MVRVILEILTEVYSVGRFESEQEAIREGDQSARNE